MHVYLFQTVCIIARYNLIHVILMKIFHQIDIEHCIWNCVKVIVNLSIFIRHISMYQTKFDSIHPHLLSGVLAGTNG